MWGDEIHELWERVGNTSGDREEDGGKHVLKSGKGFGYDIRKAKIRPSNASIRDLLGNDTFTDAILSFPKDTKVGIVKEGALIKD